MRSAVQVTLSQVAIRYGIALFAVALALFATLLIWPLVKPTSTPLFLGAIVITAWRSGKGPALVATLLSGLIIDFVFIMPQFQLSGGWDDLTRLAIFTLEGSLLSWLIVSRKEISDQVRKSREELRALSTHLQTLIERERSRIAREIHDELGRELTTLKFEVASLRDRTAKTGSETDREKFTGILKNIDGAISSVRRIATELRPAVLDTLGLTAAIEWQAKDFQNRTGIKCNLSAMEEDIQLNDETATAVFRIFQESLTNVARHANASEVWVSVDRTNRHLIMKIEDNGKGLDAIALPGARSLGIVGMQERVRLLNGQLAVEGNQDQGTIVQVRVPISNGTGLDRNND